MNAELDWDDVRFMVASARAGSLSDAARRLQVSVATVGRRIDRLEAAIGHRLFHRHSGGLALTPAAEALLSRAESIEEHVQAFARAAESIGDEQSGSVTVTSIETLNTYVIAPALGPFLAQHPGIEVVLRSDARVISLSERLADVALRVVRPSEARVVARKVSTIRFGLFASADYVERCGQPEVPSESLAGHDVVTYHSRFGGMPESQWLEARRNGAGRALRVTSAAGLAKAVHGGAGIGLVPEIMAQDSWVRLVESEALPMRDLWLVVHEDLKDAPHVRAVVEFLAEVVRREVGPPRG